MSKKYNIKELMKETKPTDVPVEEPVGTPEPLPVKVVLEDSEGKDLEAPHPDYGLISKAMDLLGGYDGLTEMVVPRLEEGWIPKIDNPNSDNPTLDYEPADTDRCEEIFELITNEFRRDLQIRSSHQLAAEFKMATIEAIERNAPESMIDVLKDVVEDLNYPVQLCTLLQSNNARTYTRIEEMNFVEVSLRSAQLKMMRNIEHSLYRMEDMMRRVVDG